MQNDVIHDLNTNECSFVTVNAASNDRCVDGNNCGHCKAASSMTLSFFFSAAAAVILIITAVLFTSFYYNPPNHVNDTRDGNRSLASVTENVPKKASLPNEYCTDGLPTLLECGHPLTNDYVFRSRKKRVVGGDLVTGSDYYPWMAKLLYPSKKRNDTVGNDTLKYKCGATVISRRYLLTAAHCVKCHEPTWAQLRNQKKLLKLEDIIVHEDYIRPCLNSSDQRSNVSRENDIALIRLEEDIVDAQPICLPLIRCYDFNQTEVCCGKSKGFVAGYGSYSNETYQPKSYDDLHQVSLPRMSFKRCDLYYKDKDNIYNKTMFCAGNETGTDFCPGDSGGPYFISVNSRSVQIGIAAFGIDPCGLGSPSVFTNVISYMSWIKYHVIL